MRSLLLFRGAPGCGKSTFIKEHGLSPYTLSADEIRLQHQSPQMNVYGKLEISGSNDREVWKTLFRLLESRMERGEFVVIDATNSKTSEMNRYKELATHYRYRMFCIDFTGLPIEECKRRNAQREPLKQVPEEAIDKMYARFVNQKIPSGIKAISADELDSIYMRKYDFSNYEKIIHIGDIHGCYTVLMDYFKNGFNDNYMYIFLGDFVDRGIENAQVVNFLADICTKPNVLMLEGNHERWLWIYANGGIAKSKEFEFVTKPELEAANVDVKKIRQLYRKLGQMAWYTYGDKEIVVTHGGISTFPENFTFIATEQFIKGVGKYEDYGTVADTWVKTTPDNMYQIFGHRNVRCDDIQLNDRVFDLEGRVEFGGELRILELDNEGFHPIAIKNAVFRETEEITEVETKTNSSLADIVLEMRKNRFINEKKWGNISSFNFSSRAFYDGVWDKQTMKARGLYINTETMKVVARSYNKFFNIDEKPETRFSMLKDKLKFPVSCYVKENGYLGLISYNEETDDLFITTKSAPDGPFAEWLKESIFNTITEENRNKIKEICKTNNVTFVVESVDMKHDPHIIEYPESTVYLLAVVKNDMEFLQVDYDGLVQTADFVGMTVKTRACVLNNWQEFYDWYMDVMDENYTFDGRIIEGFVIEDSNGFMTKAKLHYYKYWKRLRPIAHTTLRRGYIDKTSWLTDKTSNEFYAFMQHLYKTNDKEQRELIPRDMVYLRNAFYEYQKNNEP